MSPAPGDSDPEERDPGLARERTSLAWTRTAISFAALGGAVLKVNVVTGLIILAIAPLVWQLGRLSGDVLQEGAAKAADTKAGDPEMIGVTRIRLITVSIVGVSLLCLLVALLGHAAPGALP